MNAYKQGDITIPWQSDPEYVYGIYLYGRPSTSITRLSRFLVHTLALKLQVY